MLKTCCLCCWCVGGIIIHTWSAKLTVLLLLTSIHIHAPGMESKGEEVLEASGRTHYSVEAFQPFLTLFKGGELTPDGSITGYRVILCVYCVYSLHSAILIYCSTQRRSPIFMSSIQFSPDITPLEGKTTHLSATR